MGRSLADEEFHDARRKITGDNLDGRHVMLAQAAVSEAALGLLVQGKEATEEAIVQWAIDVVGPELIRDAYLHRAIQAFAQRLARGPMRVGPDC
jgi:hypothetical protein